MWASEDNSGFIVSCIRRLSCGFKLLRLCLVCFAPVIKRSQRVSVVRSSTCQTRSPPIVPTSLARNNATYQIAALRITEEGAAGSGGPREGWGGATDGK